MGTSKGARAHVKTELGTTKSLKELVVAATT